MTGVVTLGQVAELVVILRIACNRCERRGQLHTARLIARYGPAFPMPRLREMVAADCPKMQAGQTRDSCGVHFPQVAELFRN
jgi:hypothetical protein